MLIYHKGHTDTIQVYSVTVVIYVKALQAGHSSQGTSEPITPVSLKSATLNFYQMCVSDGSCLCEACMFMKHINCVNYNVHKGGLKHHQPCLFLKAIPLT